MASDATRYLIFEMEYQTAYKHPLSIYHDKLLKFPVE